MKTYVRKQTKNPRWDQVFELHGVHNHATITVTVWDWDRRDDDDPMGRVQFKVREMKGNMWQKQKDGEEDQTGAAAAEDEMEKRQKLLQARVRLQQMQNPGAVAPDGVLMLGNGVADADPPGSAADEDEDHDHEALERASPEVRNLLRRYGHRGVTLAEAEEALEALCELRRLDQRGSAWCGEDRVVESATVPVDGHGGRAGKALREKYPDAEARERVERTHCKIVELTDLNVILKERGTDIEEAMMADNFVEIARCNAEIHAAAIAVVGYKPEPEPEPEPVRRLPPAPEPEPEPELAPPGVSPPGTANSSSSSLPEEWHTLEAMEGCHNPKGQISVHCLATFERRAKDYQTLKVRERHALVDALPQEEKVEWMGRFFMKWTLAIWPAPPMTPPLERRRRQLEEERRQLDADFARFCDNTAVSVAAATCSGSQLLV